MEGGLLSLKWNNHKSTFFHVLSNVRKKKDSYSDATLACDGKFYPVHKLVLSSCSDYFEEMFDQAGQAQCKHPFIVLKDIKCDELECLLSYMYVGEVNVVQEKLAGLIKAAECLRIKGLAVPDEEPSNSSNKSSREKRQSDNSVNSEPKRRRHEDLSNSSSNVYRQNNSRTVERHKTNKEHNEITNQIFNSTSSSLPGVEHNQDIKKEETLQQQEEADEVLIDDESDEPVKSEPLEVSPYAPDSNSLDSNSQLLSDSNYGGDNPQQFMEDLMGNSSEAKDLASMSDYMEGAEHSSAGGSQQAMVMPQWFGDGNDFLDSVRYHASSSSLFKSPEGAEAVQCPECDRKFRDSWKLTVHLRTHTGEKPYQCTECSFKTAQKGNLKRHLMLHSGERPFGCSVCGKKFATKHSAEYHFKVIHEGKIFK